MSILFKDNTWSISQKGRMKIRNGFVSNSSSSSFVVFGRYNVNIEKLGVDVDVLEEKGINYYEDDESGACVGVDPDEMKSNETLLQFQTRVAKKLTDAGIPTEPSDLRFTGGSYYS